VKKEFSKQGYLGIIKFAKSNNYQILPFSDAKKNTKLPKLILRHDIDLDLHLALEMAKLENNFGIEATYFILLYNNFYNPLSPEGRKIIREIKGLGHEVGLHWDSRDYFMKNWEFWFKNNLKILGEIAGEKIVSVSQHEPISTAKMKVNHLVQNEAYSEKFFDFTYVSDSSMRWRQFTPWDLIQQKKNIHFLAHPMWWLTKGRSRKQKLLESFSYNSQAKKSFYNQLNDYINHTLKNQKELDQKFGYRNGIKVNEK